jgi:hypothetical protein
MIITIFFSCIITDINCDVKTASVYCSDRQCTYKFGNLDVESATAYGVYNDTLMESGWGILNISAGRGSKTAENVDLMFAAGYLEAILTQKYKTLVLLRLKNLHFGVSILKKLFPR